MSSSAFDSHHDPLFKLKIWEFGILRVFMETSNRKIYEIQGQLTGMYVCW